MADCKLGEKGCWKDGKCHYSHDCENKVLTNADRIRSMTDEELADFIENVANRGMEFESACQSKKECGEMLDRDEQIPDEWCRQCRVEWLHQPAEEGTP